MINSTTMFIAVLAIVIILTVICFIMNMMNTSKINTLMDYSEDGDLAGALKKYYDEMNELSETVNNTTNSAMNDRIALCEEENQKSMKKTGIVNFNAFDDVTGNLSFALTLLNDKNDGFILTSLYGHNSCNTYIRPVSAGATTIKLLREEEDSLAAAINGSTGRKEAAGKEM